MARRLSIQELEHAAGMLSNFGGDLVDYNGMNDLQAEMNAYDGGADDLVDFEGVSGLDESNLKTERIYRINVTNPMNTPKYFWLSGGLSIRRDKPVTVNALGADTTTSHGVILQDGYLYPDGATWAASAVANDCLLIAGDPHNYSRFRQLFEQNPLRVLGFKVASNVAAQMETSIRILRDSPFKDLQSKTIYLANFQNENNFQDKQVTVPEVFQLDNQTRVRFEIAASSAMTITLYCGANLNTATALIKKAAKAANFVEKRYAYNNLTQKRGLIGG